MKITSLFYTGLCMIFSLMAVSANAKPEWIPSVDGTPGLRQLSPTGDILDSNMDALSALRSDPVNLPGINITVKNLVDPQKAAEVLKKALYIPLEREKAQKLTADELWRIRSNQALLLRQASSYNLALGVSTAQNVSDFEGRKETAKTFIPSAKDRREDIQVLNGITLGQLAETNKMLAITASLALLEAAEALPNVATLTGN